MEIKFRQKIGEELQGNGKSVDEMWKSAAKMIWNNGADL